MQEPQDLLVQVGHTNMANQNLAGTALGNHHEVTTTRKGALT
jgi:hypothetical protein